LTNKFSGVLPAITTSFRDDGQLDPPSIERNIRRLLDAGVHGIVTTGTVGEAASLTADERLVVVETAVEAVNGRVPVIAGISAETAARASEYAAACASVGVDGLLCLPPTGYVASDHEIVEFFRAVGSSTSLPIMVYNNPDGSRNDMRPQLIARLSEEVPAVIAVKESSGDPRRVTELREITAGDIEILIGRDDWVLEGFCRGATGWVAGAAVVAPDACCQLYESYISGRLDEASALYGRLLPLARFDSTPKLVQYFKAGMEEVGADGGICRPPRQPLDPAEHEQLTVAVRLALAASAFTG